ncbi:MAG: bifunctional (p)ppGpp synthetase/guanosine-3',5'-bis(diphosphate) 3'-pyrophosphohydrolase [bacterium]|nr:bifunctional (p)ppGpp synthetase/guanosine-3',5'-bis(diphosphate) 3'-pyrophosphohydrolase [bacterium]
MNISKYLERAKKKNREADTKLLEKVYLYSKEAHKGQKRASGDEYFIHPLAVSLIVMDMGLDSETIAAALLHDVIEDTKITKSKLGETFSKSICDLVDGVTKLGEVDFDKYSTPGESERNLDKEVESMRKLFLATAEDIRVVFIKLADRLHNMRTLSFLKEEDRKRIAKETLDIFAPLADRLGMGQMKAELEDLSFLYYLPEEYKEVKKQVKRKITESKKYLPKIKSFLNKILDQESIEAEIDGRVKHIYAVYRKLKKHDGDIDKIYDVMAIRIIVDSIDDCYKSLGIVHAHFKPLIYRIKDYIAVPKTNGYRSLHTTVFGLDGKIIEIQIRTKEMHEEAENGVAAHWKYSENKEKIFAGSGVSLAKKQETKVVAELKSFSTVTSESFKGKTFDIFRNRIFSFSPTGDIFELPEGATPIDFAYAVHSDIAEKCIGAKVNGKIVTLDTKLENRDIVEIIASKKASGPSRDWLYFAITPRAKQKIRAYLRSKDRSQNIELGHEILDDELKIIAKSKVDAIPKETWQIILEKMPQKGKDDVLAGIGDGSLSVKQVARKLFPLEKKIKVVDEEKVVERVPKGMSVGLVGSKGIKIIIAPCCSPSSKDKIVGFITRGRGISVHKKSCKNIVGLDKERMIEVAWDASAPEVKPVNFSMDISDRKGLLSEITAIVAEMGINIAKLETKLDGLDKQILVSVDVDDVFKERLLKDKLLKVKGMKKIQVF